MSGIEWTAAVVHYWHRDKGDEKRRWNLVKKDDISEIRHRRRSDRQKMRLLYLAKVMLRETDRDHRLTLREIQARLAKYDITADRKTLYDDFRVLSEFRLEGLGSTFRPFDIRERREDNTTRYYNDLTPCKGDAGKDSFRGIETSREDGRELQPFLTEAELHLLVDAVGSSRFISRKKSQVLIAKLGTLTSHYRAERLWRDIHVTGRVKSMNESLYAQVDALSLAMQNNCQTEVIYMWWTIDKKLVPRKENPLRLSPWSLVWDDGCYYLVAYDVKDNMLKNYRVDKIANVKILDETEREGRELYEKCGITTYAKHIFGMFTGKRETVKFRLKNQFAGVLFDRFGTDIFIHPVDKYYCEATIRDIAISRQFYAWLVGLGKGVQLLSPEWAVQDMWEYLSEILRWYDE